MVPVGPGVPCLIQPGRIASAGDVLQDFLRADWFPYITYSLALLASLATGWEMAVDPKEPKVRRRFFWLQVALILAVLILLKLTGAQSFVSSEGREAAQSGGWYGDRRVAQLVAVVTMAASAALVYPLAVWAYREARYRVPLATVFILLSFVAIRAVSLHQIDAFLYRRTFLEVPWNRVLEPLFSVLVCGSALVFVAVKLAGRRRAFTRTR